MDVTLTGLDGTPFVLGVRLFVQPIEPSDQELHLHATLVRGSKVEVVMDWRGGFSTRSAVAKKVRTEFQKEVAQGLERVLRELRSTLKGFLQ